MRIILIQTTLFGVSGVLSSILNAHQHFALPALAPIALDLGYLIGITVLVPRLGIHGLAWGTVAGGLLHILIQLPAVWRYRLRLVPALALRLAGVSEIVRLMGPRIVSLGAIQATDLFIINFASRLPEGSASAYFYGYYLMQLPETLLGTAIGLVVFPTLARLYNAGDIAGLKDTAVTALRVIWLLTIPAAVALALLGRPLIGLLLQGGAFDQRAADLVYTVLLFFSVRVVSEATLEVVARLFYARHNTRTPMLAYLGWLVTNVGLAYLLGGRLGIGGLALASTIAFTALSAALFLLNRRELGSLGEAELGRTALHAVAAALVMALVLLGVTRLVSHPYLQLAVGGGLGAAAYLVVARWLQPELVRLPFDIRAFTERLRKF
jgi:putative peptidoglycan lipid II flippase